MTITIELNTDAELEQLLALFKALPLQNVNIVVNKKVLPTIEKGDKTIDPTPLFGMWKDEPRTIEEIRAKDWERNWDL